MTRTIRLKVLASAAILLFTCCLSAPYAQAASRKRAAVVRRPAAPVVYPNQDNASPWVKPPWQSTGPQQLISPADRNFLTQLKNNIKDDSAKSRIGSIADKMSSSPKLEQADYDYLTDLSQRMGNKKIASTLAQIAQKHHP